MRDRWLGVGLFFLTLSTLLLETLDARLLSVLTWYHLSFFAVSLAMLGMAGGAVYVFLHPDRFSPDRAPASLARMTFAFACTIPISHLMSLATPFLPLNDISTMEIVSIAASTLILAVPFALSGVAVTAALTRCGGRIGLLYAFDLVGAAIGCALVVPILEKSNISSAVFLAGAGAAVAAYAFAKFAGIGGRLKSSVLAVALISVALYNTGTSESLQVIYPKNRNMWLTNAGNAETHWNSHSYVLLQRPGTDTAFLWGPGKGGERFRTTMEWMAIDGEAGTPITQWDGNPDSLEWVSYDVTTLPYWIRHGNIGVIGVGGGRDLLAALWGRNPSITGIDVNRIMVSFLEGSQRQFANIANQPQVKLVHDDGRAYITRSDKNYDIIQMSLVDTWASTGAGAFTLSENGLYTLDAWRVFLSKLTPTGVLSVSRWFDPNNVSETSRLLALGVAALIDRGVAKPADQILLVVRGRVATLMVSPSPFTTADRETLSKVIADKEFQVLSSPWEGGGQGQRLLDRISHATTNAELAAATYDRWFDYSPPTDRRPYYFNMLKPQAFFGSAKVPKGGTMWGNLRATLTLLVLLGVATVLVALLIVWPLIRAGRPPMPAGRFALTMSYFGLIGFAYMLIQIALLQRFSVYLGHPTYTLAIVLFSMLLFTGAGSLVSERVSIQGRAFRLVPLVIAAVLVAIALVLPLVLSRTVTAGLAARTGIVLLTAAPLSMLLGMCFPFGVRLISINPSLVAWAWGVNGAMGVLASILAVALSIWVQIDANFWVASGLYLALSAPLAAMVQAFRGSQS